MAQLLKSLLMIVCLLLTACGKKNFDRDLNQIEAGNRYLERMGEIRQQFSNYQVQLSISKSRGREQIADSMKTVIAGSSAETLQTLRALASEYAMLGDAVVVMIENGDVTYAGDLAKFQSLLRAAKLFRDELFDAIES